MPQGVTTDPLADQMRRVSQSAPSDPLAIQMAKVRVAATGKPSLPSRLKSAVQGMAADPLGTVKGIAMAPILAASKGIDFMGQTAAEMSLPDDVRAFALADPERISEKDALISAAQLATIPATRLLTPFARMISPALPGVAGASSRVVPALAARLSTDAAFGAGAGAVYAPDDPAVGAILGGAAAPALHGAANVAGRAVRAIRAPTPEPVPVPAPEAMPSPLRVPASEAAARLAKVVEPQAIDAPVSTAESRSQIAALDEVIAANKVAPKAALPATPDAFPEGYSTPSLTKLRRPGASVAAETPVSNAARETIAPTQAESAAPEVPRTGVDEATGLPLNADGTVTLYHHTSAAKAKAITTTGKLRADAEPDVYLTTRAETDTGYGDTAVPVRVDPAKLQIDDEFPNGRKDFRLQTGKPGGEVTVSVGRDLNEPGRIPPEAPKVVNPRGSEPSGVIQTPEGVVSVGPREIPAAAGKAHRPTLPLTDEAFAPAEPVAPKGPKPKGEWKDLSETPDDVLQAESQRIKELHASEEASVAFKDTPEWRDWQNLPDKEKLGKSTRTTDNHGNAIKRTQEDLPDAYPEGGEVLAERRKTLADYNKRTLVRTAEANRATAIDAELSRREASVESMPKTPAAEHEAYMQSVMQDAPDPRAAPREYLNYAKFGLDKTTEGRLRDTVAELRKTGEVDKGYQSFAEQQAQADAFAHELVQNPLDIDRAKLKNLTGAEVQGVMQVASQNTKMIEGLSQAMESGTMNAGELAQASTLLDRAVQSTNEALATIVREKSQTARDLGFFRQMAKMSTDPDVWLVQAKKLLGDKPLTDQMMIEIRTLAREAAEACL